MRYCVFKHLLFGFCFLTLLCVATTSALAATLTVTNTANSGPGTLRAALASAANGDTINATGVSGTILLTNGQLSVTKSVTILGPGPDSLAVNGNAVSRVFYINPDLVVTIAGLTITNGFVSDIDDLGAGIHNDQSTLTVSNCAFRGNRGGFGGGIFNNAYLGGSAALLVSSSTFSSNSASYGGGAIGTQAGNESATVSANGSTFSGNNSGGFYGGAILNDGVATTNAILTVSNCTFSSNSTAEGGAGGAIANLSFGTTTASSSTFTNNLASYGGGALFNGGNNSGNATLTVSNCTISGNSANTGGGLYNSGNDGVATTWVLNSTISGNSINDPNGGGGGFYNDGGFSTNSAPLVVVLNSTISSNSGPYGGGIFNRGPAGIATVTISNCTLRANSASALGGAIYNDGNSSGSATFSVIASTVSSNSASNMGGAIYNEGVDGSATVTMLNTTFSGNSATDGGGIYNEGATLNIGSTILNAGASGANIVNNPGTVVSLGYNLSSDNGGGSLTNNADQINTDPQLGPLQNNGGTTFTHALLINSPAIDQGKNLSGLTTDQRGLPRPVDLAVANATDGDGSDIGAFEVQVAIIPTTIFLTSPQKLLNGSFQFSFTNTPGASFTVLRSTNIALPLTNWTVLGPPTEISPGNFQYADPQATNQPQGFYGVRSP